ncbi:MAG: hypothetical protein ABIH23_33295 [bacterium]
MSKTPLLAYFLRADPSFGEEIVRKECLGTKPNMWMLGEIAKLKTHPVIEEVAIKGLFSEDPETASRAASILKEYGSADAEKCIWQRYEQWHAKWKGREEELNRRTGRDDPNRMHIHLEEGLFRALTGARSWIFDLEELKRIQELCITAIPQKLARLEIEVWSGKIPIRIVLYNDEVQSLEVGWYECSTLSLLREKLNQFPKGTSFSLSSFAGVGLDDREKIFVDLRAFLEDRGMTIEKEKN